MSWQSHTLHHDQTKHPTENFILTSDLMEATRGQKHPSEAENGMKDTVGKTVTKKKFWILDFVVLVNSLGFK
jgi:hypothetical protein